MATSLNASGNVSSADIKGRTLSLCPIDPTEPITDANKIGSASLNILCSTFRLEAFFNFPILSTSINFSQESSALPNRFIKAFNALLSPMLPNASTAPQTTLICGSLSALMICSVASSEPIRPRISTANLRTSWSWS